MVSLRQYAQVRIRRLFSQLGHVPRGLAMVWAAAPTCTLLWIIVLVAQGLIPIGTVYLTRAIVNTLVAAVRAGGTWATMRPTLVAAAWLAGVMLASELLRVLATWLRTAQSELAYDYITKLIHQKSMTVDLAFYEMPEFYDHLHRARAEATYRPILLVETVGSLLQNSITMIAMLAVLVPFGPVLPLTLLISTAPALYLVLKSNLHRHEFAHRSTTTERQSWYYDSLLTSGGSAGELRLFDLGGYFQMVYTDLRSRLCEGRLKLAREHGVSELLASLIATALSGVAMFWMVLRTMRGLLSLGDLALFYQAFGQGLGLARSLLENVGRLYENSLFLGNLFAFLELQPQIVGPPYPARVPLATKTGIRFHNVTFRYPASERDVLRGFNLTVKPGQLVAIVGTNGSGKTTLVKLLCRFYDPTDGHIEMDGIPIRDFSPQQLRRNISIFFQQPMHYDASASQNISYGDRNISDPAAIRAAAARAGAVEFIQRLPQGFETNLGKSFIAGAELSVGEWHRLAMARTLFREAPILVLDEPTSTMDPWAEIEWAERLRRSTRDKIVIIITHRFTTAMFADVIHVMSEGRIVESGKHDGLIEAGGFYARGWAAQLAT
jgi:ATP-binding cassette, subfamily B, bacterial